jgi:hypothetical protein
MHSDHAWLGVGNGGSRRGTPALWKGVGSGGREKGDGRGADLGEFEAQNPIPPVPTRVSGGEDRDGGAPGVAAGDFSGGSQEADSIPPSAFGGRRCGQGDSAAVKHSAVGDRIHREVVDEESAGGVVVAREGRMELDYAEDLDSDSFCKVSMSGSRGVPWPDGDRGWKAYGVANLGSWFRSVMPSHSGMLGTVRPWRNRDGMGVVLDKSELVGPFGGKQTLPNSVEGGGSN